MLERRIKYVLERENAHIEWLRSNDYNIISEIDKRISKLKSDMIRDTNDWAIQFSTENNIDLHKLVSVSDLNKFKRRVEKYVSDSERYEITTEYIMRWYNEIMRMKAQEYLIRTMGMYLGETLDDMDHEIGIMLKDMTLDELKRQAGILGLPLGNEEALIRRSVAIAESDFHGVTFSKRLWDWQQELSNVLNDGIYRSLLIGKHPSTWAKNLAEFYIGEADKLSYALKRLAVTETARAQIEAQKYQYTIAGLDGYVVICEPTACPECMPYDGVHQKLEDMTVGVTAPPFHPNCRCSTAGDMNYDSVEEAIQKWRNFINNSV